MLAPLTLRHRLVEVEERRFSFAERRSLESARWTFKWISFPSSVLFVVLLHLQMCKEGHARNHFLMNADDNIANTNSRNLDYQAEYHECYITVQEVRRIGGQCVKIKDNFQGCVAGSLMDPFHQDCL